MRDCSDTGKGVQLSLGIAYIASYVRKYGDHKIEILDLGAGCIQAEFGFESGSEKTLKNLKGGSVTVEDNRKAVELCNSVGISILGNFLIDSPA